MPFKIESSFLAHDFKGNKYTKVVSILWEWVVVCLSPSLRGVNTHKAVFHTLLTISLSVKKRLMCLFAR